jgi:tetratricopeptide (TPR) repeat protein
METLPIFRPALSGRVALASALLQRAQSARTDGDLIASREAITAAIPIDPTPAARYLYAELLADAGDLSAAIVQLEEAWEHARRVTSPEWRAHCCHALAELQRARGQADAANRYRQLAIAAELDAGTNVDAAAWLQDRAADCLSAGEIDDAETLLDTVGRIVLRDSERQARLAADRGVLALRRGRWSQGVRWLVRAFHSLKAAGDLHGCAETVLKVGCILQMRGEWRRAKSCFQQSARTFRRLQAREPLQRALRYVSECSRMLAAVQGDPGRN